MSGNILARPIKQMVNTDMAKTILICDDDPTQRRLIQAVLEREGFSVLHAENGAQAYERLSQNSGIDAVILDLVMPGQSGIDTLK